MNTCKERKSVFSGLFIEIPHVIIRYLPFSVPAGFTTYKLTFHITEELTNYQNAMHPISAYPEYYMCTPYIQSVNDLLRERVGHCIP